jgi:hypothetical protein
MMFCMYSSLNPLSFAPSFISEGVGSRGDDDDDDNGDSQFIAGFPLRVIVAFIAVRCL